MRRAAVPVLLILLLGCDRERPQKDSPAEAVGVPVEVDAQGELKPIVPDDDAARISRFDNMLNQGAYTQMIEEIPVYLETYPNSYKAHHLLGWAYIRSDRLDEAMAAFDKSIELNPQWDNAYVGQGVVWRKRGDQDKAVASYRKAIAVNPKAAEAYSSLTAIELARGNYQEAYEVGGKAWELSDKHDGTIAANFAIACHYAKQDKQRDEMIEHARKLGYASIDRLDELASGKWNPF
ncbi:MAG: tetratricopeptide repeat protein [Myxococcales bacterium]|nr:tetratricopeptide repeat protein [Myxococcales bacterium]